MSPEEKEQRRKEFFDLSDKRLVLIEKMCAAHNSLTKDKELYSQLLNELVALDPRECEHGRSWASNCMACDEIHMEVFPEHYDACITCSKLFNPDELVDGRCDNCEALFF